MGQKKLYIILPCRTCEAERGQYCKIKGYGTWIFRAQVTHRPRIKEVDNYVMTVLKVIAEDPR